MLGYAWQKGWSAGIAGRLDARDRTQRRRDREMNKAAVQLGTVSRSSTWPKCARPPVPFSPGEDARTGGCDGPRKPIRSDDTAISASLDEQIARRVAFLGDYQDAAYAQKL